MSIPSGLSSKYGIPVHQQLLGFPAYWMFEFDVFCGSLVTSIFGNWSWATNTTHPDYLPDYLSVSYDYDDRNNFKFISSTSNISFCNLYYDGIHLIDLGKTVLANTCIFHFNNNFWRCACNTSICVDFWFLLLLQHMEIKLTCAQLRRRTYICFINLN